MAISTPQMPALAGERWRSRRVLAWALRALIFLAPLAAAVLASLWLSKVLFDPSSPAEIVAWWVALVGFSSLVGWAVDRFGRRFLPLTVLLKMTMLFPDRAPSRYRVALRTSNVKELRRRVEEADGDLSKSAEVILSLGSALNDHDRRTRGHGERTRAYTDLLAEELGISEEDRDKLRWAALLHDIGKLEVPADVLNKDGPLDDEEMAVVRRHPIMGMTVAAPLVPWLGEWSGAIEHHHEWFDGSGYPRGLRGQDISLAARIVSVADAFDVMTSGRSYKKAMSPADARRELARMAGVQFDPLVVRALMNVSLGRLRWVIGPAALFGQIPFHLDRLGRDFVTVSTAAAVTMAGVVAGAVPIPALISAGDVDMTMTAEADLASGPDAGGSAGAAGSGGAIGQSDGAITVSVPPPAETTSTTLAPTTTVPESTTTVPESTTSTTAPPIVFPTTTTPPSTTPTSPPPSTPTTTTPLVTTTTVPSATTTTTTTVAPATTTTTLPPTTITTTTTTLPPATTTTTLPPTTTTTTTTTTTLPPATTTTTVPVEVVLTPDTATTEEDTAVVIAVLANDPVGMSIAEVTTPARGTATIDNGAILYLPNQDYHGSDAFTYRACDAVGTCGEAEVTVTVTPVPDPPVAVDDAFTWTLLNLIFGFDVLANDTDPEDDLDPVTLRVVDDPELGLAWFGGDNRLRYLPEQPGTYSLDYEVCDTTGLCGAATVTIRVRSIPD